MEIEVVNDFGLLTFLEGDVARSECLFVDIFFAYRWIGFGGQGLKLEAARAADPNKSEFRTIHEVRIQAIVPLGNGCIIYEGCNRPL